MQPMQRPHVATRSAHTTTVLSRAASAVATGVAARTADTSVSQPGSRGDSLLIAMDTANREQLRGQLELEPAGTGGNQHLEGAIQGMQQNLKSLAADPQGFHDVLSRSFGKTYDRAAAETIRQQVIAGDFSWMPSIRVVDAATLTDQSGQQTGMTGLGAYSAATNTLYISGDLLAADPARAARILTEEVGHALDAQLNAQDAAGDEGDIFARLVGGETLNDATLATLRSENDTGTIWVDGQSVEVEYGNIVSNAFKKVSGAVRNLVEGVADTVKDVVKGVSDTVSNVVGGVVDGVRNGVSTIWQGVSNGVRSLVNSSFFNTVMAFAQFVPIPFVAVAATAYNAARAGYQVYQGVKHGSIGAVLGGVAGLAGGAASLGGLVGTSQKFITTAHQVSRYAGHASQAYRAVAEKDFTSALAIASTLFSRTSAAGALRTAHQVSSTRDAMRTGDYGAALSSASQWLGDTTTHPAGQLFKDIAGHAAAIEAVVKGVRAGDYQRAAVGFLDQYGAPLGLDAAVRRQVLSVTGVLETAGDARALWLSGQQEAALQSAADSLGWPLDDRTAALLRDSFALRDAIRDERFDSATRTAAALARSTGQPPLASHLDQLATWLAAINGNRDTPRTPPYVPGLVRPNAGA